MKLKGNAKDQDTNKKKKKKESFLHCAEDTSLTSPFFTAHFYNMMIAFIRYLSDLVQLMI